MPRLDVVVSAPVTASFRVQQIAGLFDLPLSARSELRFATDLPGLDESWSIGAIVGPSGSGKSTIAREAYAAGAVAQGALVTGYDWPSDAAVVDGFPAELSGKDITAMLNSVGFSSPPAWVRPYRVLSNGERFRCDLARALLCPTEVVAFDEFTSVVDRQVARFGAAAVAKAIRAGRARCGRFVAVTCHYDVLEWLQPDWWLDMATCELARGCLQRPPIELHLVASSKRVWGRYRRHHYLSSALNPAARCYEVFWNQTPVGFCATIPMFGYPGRRLVHRLVVLPDYQGLGIGSALLNGIARHESAQRCLSIVTSHPALIRALARQANWRCTRVSKCGVPQAGVKRRTGKRIGSMGRVTASFRYLPAA